MENLNRANLIDLVSEKTGVSKKDTRVVVSELFDVITNALVNGNSVNVTGFVKMTPRVRAARKARNLQTGTIVDVPAKKAVSFKAGKSLKDSLNS